MSNEELEEQDDSYWRELWLALADNPYAPAPWRTYKQGLKESGIVDRKE